MLYIYTGSDREAARKKMSADIQKVAKGAEIVRVTDVHAPHDMQAALQGGGMFAQKRVVVFEGVLAHPEMKEIFLEVLPFLGETNELFFAFEEKILAEMKKKLEKHAKTFEKFDAPKKGFDGSVFGLANALKRGDKKALWVGYMEEIGKGSAPEAVHGVLFWGAKDMYVKAGSNVAIKAKAQKLVAMLAELPHAARRRGEDLEYALERFTLSV